MCDILICTHNPLLIKGLHDMLRNAGCRVALADHTAEAVQTAMKRFYHAVILDAQAFGMPAEDAAEVIRTVSPDTKIILVGHPECEADAKSITVPLDLEQLRSAVHGIHNLSAIS